MLMFCGKNDILLISDTKLDSLFSSSQIVMDGYSNIYEIFRNDK